MRICRDGHAAWLHALRRRKGIAVAAARGKREVTAIEFR
jgi:hypothetical protein